MRRAIQAIREYLTTPIRQHWDLAQNDVQEEIQFHLASRIEDYHDEGMSLDDSKAAALNQFGDVDRVVQECCRATSAWQILVHRSHLLLTSVLLITTALLSLQVLSNKPTTQSNAVQLIPQPPTNETLPHYDGDIAGLVVDGLGKRLARAHVMVAVKWWPENGFRQQCYMRTTDANGAFKINNVYPSDTQHEVQIAAMAEGHLLTSQYIDDQSLPLNSLAIQLPSARAELAVEFQSATGQPVSGVSAFPHQRFESTGVGHTVYFQSADRIIQQSDDGGCLKFSNFSPGDRAVVFVQFPDDEWQQREIVVPDDDSVVVITQPPPQTKGG